MRQSTTQNKGELTKNNGAVKRHPMRGIVVNAWLALCLVFRRGLAKQTLEHTVVK